MDNVPLYYIQAKFTKSSQGTRKKSSLQLEIMTSLYYGRQCNPKTLKRTILDLYQIPLKRANSQ